MRKLNKLYSLRWQLSLRFTFATTATMFVILTGISIFVFSRIFISNWQLSPEKWISIAEKTALPVTRRFLEESSDNTELIELWLTVVASPVSYHRLIKIGETEITMRFVRASSAMLIDSDGSILGYSSSEEEKQDVISRSFKDFNPMNNSETIEYLLSGGRDPDKMIRRSKAEEGFTITLPVDSETDPGRMLGILSVRFDKQYSGKDVATYTLKTVCLSISALLLLTAIIALLFAFFTARKLTTRLRRFSFMAEKWSMGDFSFFINDERSDEIGMLARRFDMMAEQTALLLQKQKENAIAAERQRMAMDLHDSVKQQALAASMQLGTAMQMLQKETEGQYKAAAIHLSKTESLLNSIRSELIYIVNNKFEDINDERDIITVINNFLDSWSAQNEIKIIKKIRPPEFLPAEISQTVYRIIQEALFNISRHSGADEAEVEYCRENDTVILRIRDNGGGFSLQKTKEGNGLRSMKERCKSGGGSFSIQSNVKQGTIIEAAFRVGDADEG